MGVAEQGDPFAVEVEFFAPPVTGWQRAPQLVVFTDPVGGNRSGDLARGIGVGVSEEPGKPPHFTWYVPGRADQAGTQYTGLLPASFTGRWHTLRIEGSRRQGWFRALLDGRALAVSQGTYDLSGRHVVLAAGYGFMNPEDVAFSNLRTFAGTPECQ
jgi:hypothetical protein